MQAKIASLPAADWMKAQCVKDSFCSCFSLADSLAVVLSSSMLTGDFLDRHRCYCRPQVEG